MVDESKVDESESLVLWLLGVGVHRLGFAIGLGLLRDGRAELLGLVLTVALSAEHTERDEGVGLWLMNRTSTTLSWRRFGCPGSRWTRS